MKIINKQPKVKRFYELENGTVFRSGPSYFMKTERIETGDFSCNAVDLSNGTLVTMFLDAVVALIDCELVTK